MLSLHKFLLAVLLPVIMLMVAGNSYAGTTKDKVPKIVVTSDQESSDEDSTDGQPRAVPEIDATSGIPAAAFVLGVTLLGAERLRRRSQRAT